MDHKERHRKATLHWNGVLYFVTIKHHVSPCFVLDVCLFLLTDWKESKDSGTLRRSWMLSLNHVRWLSGGEGSLSPRVCVRTNKEADCCCPQWFIPLLCLPSARHQKLIKAPPWPCIPSQTAGANHWLSFPIPPPTPFFFFNFHSESKHH